MFFFFFTLLYANKCVHKHILPAIGYSSAIWENIFRTNLLHDYRAFSWYHDNAWCEGESAIVLLYLRCL